MADAVLSRGATSVTIPILSDGSELAVARDIGKPTANLPAVGREAPRSLDYQNAGDQWTVTGILHGGSAYADAKTLAEGLILPRGTTGTPLQLDLSDLPGHGTYDVAPISDSAASLTYQPGRRDMVGVQLSLSSVSQTIGGSQTSATAGTPDSGSGVKLERTGTSTTVTLSPDLTVTRTVGRPNGKLQPTTGDLPIYIDQNKSASDVFEFSADNLADSSATTLGEDIIRGRLGTDPLRLHFLGSLFGLDRYDVFPDGSQAVRYTFQTAETGYVGVPTLKLRRVNND